MESKDIEILDSLIKESILISGVKVEDDELIIDNVSKDGFWVNIGGNYKNGEIITSGKYTYKVAGIKIRKTKVGDVKFYFLKFL